MKKLSIICTLALMLVALHSAPSRACGLTPVAVIITDPDAMVFYSGEPVLLVGSGSYARCGNLHQYRWRVREPGWPWVTIYEGPQSTYTHSFVLPGGQSELVYELELRVRDTNNRTRTRSITVTVTRENKSLYYLTDHLGSVRVTVNERGDVVGWDDYYPFGLQMPGRTQNIANEHDDVKFTGHELEQQGGLGLYHAQARMYDPAIGRFMSVDPLAHLYPGVSPYVYVLNNPLIFTDPTGEYVVDTNGNRVDIVTTQDEDGNYINSYTFADKTEQSVIDDFHANAGTILDAMALTEEGRVQLGNLVNADYSIRMTLT